jgi:hypothetical protein
VADPVQEHIETICEEAMLGVMVQVLEIVRDREEVPEESLLGLDADDVTEMYEGWIGPAIDRLEKSLLGDYD